MLEISRLCRRTIFLSVPLLLVALGEPCFARDLTPAEKQIVEQVVSKDFKDPAAALFRWRPIADSWSMEYKSASGDTTGMQVYCGMVNGKNSYGAYTGFTPFAVMLVEKNGTVGLAFLVGVGVPGEGTEIATYRLCKEKGFDPSLSQ